MVSTAANRRRPATGHCAVSFDGNLHTNICDFFLSIYVADRNGLTSQKRIQKRSTKETEENSNYNSSKPPRTSVPPPPARKIVYVNPSQEFYLGRKSLDKKQQSHETEEDDRESSEFIRPSYYDDQPDYQQNRIKDVIDDHKQSLKNDLFVKHDDLLDNKKPKRKPLFTPNQQESYESDEEENFDYSSSPGKPETDNNIIPKHTPNTNTLLPQSSRRVNTIKSLDTFSVRSHDWKHDILEEMRVSLTNCCIQCKTQTLTHLEKTLQLIHRYLTRELDEHYAQITSSLRTTGRNFEHNFPGDKHDDKVRDDDIDEERFQNTTPNCDIEKVPLTPSSRQIVQVQLNDNVSEQFKKIVFEVSKPDSKATGRNRKIPCPLSKLKANRNEAIRQRQRTRKGTT